MSCALFTVLTLVSAGLQKSVTWQVEVTAGLALFFLVVSLVMSLREAHQELKIMELKWNKDNGIYELRLKASEDVANDLRRYICDLQFNLKSKESDIERIINTNRPELFARIAGSLTFSESNQHSSWDDDPHMVCDSVLQIINSGKSTAYEVIVDPVYSETFRVDFASLAKIHIDSATNVNARLYCYPTFEYVEDPSTVSLASQLNTNGFMSVETSSHAGVDKKINIGGSIYIKLKWRDSSNNWFSSTSEGVNFSAIERIEAPIEQNGMLEVREETENY